MTCEELLQALNAYVDDESALAACKEFADHLAECNPCQVVVDNIRNTIKLYQNGAPYPMPPEFEARMKSALRSAWERKFAANSSVERSPQRDS
jgi:anti-sigma factor RsiW